MNMALSDDSDGGTAINKPSNYGGGSMESLSQARGQLPATQRNSS